MCRPRGVARVEQSLRFVDAGLIRVLQHHQMGPTSMWMVNMGQGRRDSDFNADSAG